nr:hypothetical protein [Anaerolineae bacterium]
MNHRMRFYRAICTVLVLCALAIVAVPVAATPATQARDPYIFRGVVVDADEEARPMPVLDVQVACTGAPAVTVQTDDGEWEFNEDVELGPGTLPLTTTCDIELQLPARYQAVRV